MEYQRLGLTDLKVSRIGFGCWAIGGHGYGNVDDSESIKAIHKALDLGINFFDTADVYGFGHSEEILGKALGGKRNDVIVATKFGVNWDENRRTFKDCSAKRIVEALDGSLRRLKIDCIPLYQIHWHDGKTPIEDVMEALFKCKEEGKIKYIGGSNFPFELTKEAMKTGMIDSIQLPYNFINKNWSDEIVHYVSALKLGVIAYQVLARGLLAGKFNENIQFGPQDTRAFDKDFQGSKFIKNLNIVRKMKKIALKYGKTTSQLAIRWVLDNPNVSCALVGALTQIQVVDNCGALEIFLFLIILLCLNHKKKK
jgi:aryl-alcohol dehydrogenase-like predicted oxidoreductase